jgi:hypothetical protein
MYLWKGTENVVVQRSSWYVLPGIETFSITLSPFRHMPSWFAQDNFTFTLVFFAVFVVLATF